MFLSFYLIDTVATFDLITSCRILFKVKVIKADDALKQRSMERRDTRFSDTFLWTLELNVCKWKVTQTILEQQGRKGHKRPPN